MTKFFTLLLIALFCLVGGSIQAAGLPGDSNGIQQPQEKNTARFISLQGKLSNNKVMLEWSVAENEAANQFEVQRSEDGKEFVMAALVFGTDKPQTDAYQFYEKANTKKVLYRIKLIGKDSHESYSTVIEINPVQSTNQ